MTELTIEVLKKIIEHIPDNYKIYFDDGKNNSIISDKFEIDVGLERLVLKKY